MLRFFFVFLISISCYAQDTELFVIIPVNKTFYPLYLSKIGDNESQFASEYHEELYQILHYDFAFNGKHSLLPFCLEKEKILSSGGFNAKEWKTLNVSHVIKSFISNKQMHVMLFITPENVSKEWKNIPITGDLNQDRQTLHRISDEIFETLFNIPGIASTKILFAKEQTHPDKQPMDWCSEIWQCDYDGANNHQVTYEKNYCISPVYVDKSSFIYVNYKQGQPKLYLSSFGSATGERILSLPGNQLLPTISRNRDKLAFICDAGGRADLFVQLLHPEKGLIGKPIQVYSYPRSVQASPSFSPESDKIAFVSDKEGTPRIYLIDLPLNIHNNFLPTAHCLTRQNRENICPSWSPDGTKLAYSAKTNETRQIWIYDFVKSEEQQLTHGPRHKENPNWAPDSKHIVFNTTDPSYFELYIIELDSGKSQKISDGSGKKHYPAWQPR